MVHWCNERPSSCSVRGNRKGWKISQEWFWPAAARLVGRRYDLCTWIIPPSTAAPRTTLDNWDNLWIIRRRPPHGAGLPGPKAPQAFTGSECVRARMPSLLVLSFIIFCLKYLCTFSEQPQTVYLYCQQVSCRQGGKAFPWKSAAAPSPRFSLARTHRLLIKRDLIRRPRQFRALAPGAL